MMKFYKGLLTFGMLFSIAALNPSSVFADSYYVDDQQYDEYGAAKPEYPEEWTRVGPASNYWMPGEIKGYAMYNSSKNISKSRYDWVFLGIHLSGTYEPAVWLNSAKFVDLVNYKFKGNVVALDQEYARAGWNYLEDIAAYSKGTPYLTLERATYYGGMGADGAQLLKLD